MNSVRAAATAIATLFWVGRLPKAPGTFGAAAAAGIGWLVYRGAGWPVWSLLALAALATPVAMWAADSYSRRLGRKDPGEVVIDEVIGQWIALAAVSPENPLSWLAAFGLFRLFDIWKPFPVRRLEALPGGIGIVADDAMAGIYAALVLLVANWFNL